MSESLYLVNYDPWSEEITFIRKSILMKEDCKNSDFIKDWFTDDKWKKNQFTYSTVAYSSAKEVVGMSSVRVFSDKTMKILCHYYIFPEHRKTFRSISQTDFIPYYVQFGLSHGLKGLWYTIHAFDKRHRRLKESVLRGMNGGQKDIQDQPYVFSFSHQGETVYNNVIQDKFYLNLLEI